MSSRFLTTFQPYGRYCGRTHVELPHRQGPLCIPIPMIVSPIHGTTLTARNISAMWLGGAFKCVPYTAVVETINPERKSGTTHSVALGGGH